MAKQIRRIVTGHNVAGKSIAVMDEGETCMIAGDVLIQRGTNHAWSNRSREPACVAFILVGATPRS